MELWIRSQDKTRLSVINNIQLVEWGGEYSLVGYTKDYVDDFDLGKYKSKERALEVLDEIQEHLLKMGENEILTDKNGIMNEIKYYGIVYEMPKE